MCLQCPQSLQPPNQQIQHCRTIAKTMAGALFVLGLVGFITGNVSQLIIILVIVYVLYISWAQFDWQCALIAFVWSLFQSLFSIILLVGIISGYPIRNQEAVFIILSAFVYPCVFIYSHYIYKRFKHLKFGNATQINLIGGLQSRDQGYRNMQAQQLRQINRNQPRNQAPINNSQYFFRGQGILIGQ